MYNCNYRGHPIGYNKSAIPDVANIRVYNTTAVDCGCAADLEGLEVLLRVIMYKTFRINFWLTHYVCYYRSTQCATFSSSMCISRPLLVTLSFVQTWVVPLLILSRHRALR